MPATPRGGGRRRGALVRRRGAPPRARQSREERGDGARCSELPAPLAEPALNRLYPSPPRATAARHGGAETRWRELSGWYVLGTSNLRLVCEELRVDLVRMRVRDEGWG